MSGWLRSLRARLLAGMLALAPRGAAGGAGTVVYTQQRALPRRPGVDDQVVAVACLAQRALDAKGVGRRPAGSPSIDRDHDGRGPATMRPPGGRFRGCVRRDAAMPQGWSQGSVVLTYGEEAPSKPHLPSESARWGRSYGRRLRRRIARATASRRGAQPADGRPVVAVPLSGSRSSSSASTGGCPR